MRRILCSILAIAGGLLIFSSGVRTQSFALEALVYISKFFPPTVSAVVDVVAFTMAAVISLGGILVIGGGILVLRRHTSTGKLLIILGGGIGFIGIAISMGYYVFVDGLSILATRIDYWIGLFVATLARYVARGPE
jgi:hypothetical protein